jgi:type I restriction enzyme S subunit
MDSLISGLDDLIAKKRDIKQATMQQLLTGKTRLPGFSGEWEVKRLVDVAEIRPGINKPIANMGTGTLYVTVQDVYREYAIQNEGLTRIQITDSEQESYRLESGDVVFGKSSVKRTGIGYPGKFLGCDECVVFSGFTYRARARKGIYDQDFLFYALREDTTRRWVINNSQASALTNMNFSIAASIPVCYPPSLPEQQAIAKMLTDMDADLEALEQRRDKTRELKQAMMQELLTGRTRLV